MLIHTTLFSFLFLQQFYFVGQSDALLLLNLQLLLNLLHQSVQRIDLDGLGLNNSLQLFDLNLQPLSVLLFALLFTSFPCRNNSAIRDILLISFIFY